MNVHDIVRGPWAIEPKVLETIQDVFYKRANGETTEWLEARAGQDLTGGKHRPYTVRDGVAIISVEGVIAQRMNLFMSMSGGTSTQLLDRDIGMALEDPGVDGIVLAIDSPGGTVAGTPDVAARIHAGRATKPIVAWSDGVMASAAYWIGMAAEEIFVSSKVTQVGSIGVVAAHRDVSEAEKQAGVKTTEIYAGKYKRIASQYQPLTPEGRQSIQDQVDYLYSVFVGTVADYRGKSIEDVLDRMADGRVLVGQQAIDAGLVDGMASLDEVIAIVSQRAADKRGQKDMEFRMLTVDQVKADHAEVASALKAEGATAERARIKELRGLALPGHEALIESMIEDGTSPEAAAVKVLAAEKSMREKVVADLDADRPQALPHVNPPTAKAPAIDPSLPLEDRAKAEYASSPELRKEFASVEAYTAYRRASTSGRARILNKKD